MLNESVAFQFQLCLCRLVVAPWCRKSADTAEAANGCAGETDVAEERAADRAGATGSAGRKEGADGRPGEAGEVEGEAEGEAEGQAGLGGFSEGSPECAEEEGPDWLRDATVAGDGTVVQDERFLPWPSGIRLHEAQVSLMPVGAGGYGDLRLNTRGSRAVFLLRTIKQKPSGEYRNALVMTPPWPCVATLASRAPHTLRDMCQGLAFKGLAVSMGSSGRFLSVSSRFDHPRDSKWMKATDRTMPHSGSGVAPVIARNHKGV